MASFFKRENSNKVLFQFDSIFDLQLAVVHALQEDYPPGGSVHSINYSFLHQSNHDLKQHRVYDIGQNIIQNCFLGPMRDKYQSTYKLYLEDDFDRVIEKAPITSLIRLISAYTRFGTRSKVEPVIFCNDVKEKRIVERVFKTLPIKIIIGNIESINLNDYARIVLGDVRTIDNYNKPEYVHIAVLNYADNFQIVNNQAVIIPEYILKYGDTNIFEIIDSYRDVIPPDIKKEE